ncbi:MAG TPA: ATP-binding cassette domain-containing protein, partial [Clostridia bacterium]|nr:ATP-binding cassette domain-containing protein [Clostridia bacterium]
MVTFEEVTKIYSDGTKAVDSLDLHVQKGECVVFIGPSGCGKTTSLKMINRLEEVSSGRILINGKDIRESNAVKLRRNIGYVIQETGLMPHLTVSENIA